MCDLIDLDNTVSSSLDTKLASPLIPAPSNIDRKNIYVPDNRLNNNNTLITEKRESIGDNPFDALLNEAIENVRKKEDPFEIVYEKALIKNDVPVLKENNVNITDDLKATQLSCKLKENKTSNESLSNPDNVVSTNEVNSLDLSILSYSAMNDTLYESNYNEKETDITNMLQQRISLNNKKSESDVNNLLPINIISEKTRSHSQGDIMHECKQLFKSTSSSAIDTLKTQKRSINESDNKSSSIFNKGFVEDQYNDISVFSTISNISSIARHSGSLTHNSVASMISDNTMNLAFLDNRSSSVACDTKLHEKMNNIMSTISTVLLPITPTQKQIDTSILVQKLSELKSKIEQSHISVKDNNESDVQQTNIRTTVDVDNTLPDGNDKLLDIDTCIPEITYSKFSNNSCSDSSSDSVFLKNNNINKSIIKEAKALARTFEEFAGKSSESNSDELIIDDPMWTSNLLPAFEDDVVDNLIEVPVLNATNREKKNSIMLSCNSNTNDKTKSQINAKGEIDIAPLNQTTVNKTAASTLLVDLKQIVKTESNSEANRLLEDLEKVLGIQSSNNIELSSTYFQTTNDSKAIKSTEEEKDDNKGHADDVKTYKIKVKESRCDNKIKEYEAVDDNKKLLIKENEVLNDLSSINPTIEISPKKESSVDAEKEEINVDINNLIQNNVIKNKEESNRTENNEKVAVELLINLGKVLSGQSKESATLNLLKNLREVLNLVPKNDQEKNKQDNVISSSTEQMSIKNKSGNKIQSSTSLKVKQRRSVDLPSKTKPSYQKVFRRSICGTSTSPPKKLQKSFVVKENNKSQLGIDKVNPNKNNSKEKPPIKLAVKNQLKYKSKSEIVNKKGPMKAIIPIGNMQRKGNTTSPKSPKNVQSCIKIFSSTPNSMENGFELKKSPKLKPMASSTPDSFKCKSIVQLPIIQRPERLNVSCDISPINVKEEVTTEQCKVYFTVSPRRVNKCPSPRKRTPKSQKRESSIPKYSMSPGVRVRTPSQDINKSQEISMLSQSLSRKEENILKKSPMISKKIEKSELKSPLKDSNKNITKGKPFNLSSKFRGNNNEMIESEKENTFS